MAQCSSQTLTQTIMVQPIITSAPPTAVPIAVSPPNCGTNATSVTKKHAETSSIHAVSISDLYPQHRDHQQPKQQVCVDAHLTLHKSTLEPSLKPAPLDAKMTIKISPPPSSASLSPFPSPTTLKYGPLDSATSTSTSTSSLAPPSYSQSQLLSSYHHSTSQQQQQLQDLAEPLDEIGARSKTDATENGSGNEVDTNLISPGGDRPSPSRIDAAVSVSNANANVSCPVITGQSASTLSPPTSQPPSLSLSSSLSPPIHILSNSRLPPNSTPNLHPKPNSPASPPCIPHSPPPPPPPPHSSPTSRFTQLSASRRRALSFSSSLRDKFASLSKMPKNLNLSQFTPELGSLTGENAMKEVVYMDIQFVPFTIPKVRRLQTLAVALWELSLPIMSFCFLTLLSHPPLWPFIAMYLIWVFWIDKSPEHGGRSSEWFRRSAFWRYFAGYYPVSLKKEQDLPPDRPYVFGYHPHGIIGMGALATFATESTGFSEHYPGITPHLLTLASNFQLPLYREILLWLGVCSVSKKSCENVLSGGEGQAICIVVGGAAESLYAHPGTADLTLRRRLGFIKVAMQHGADLVPVFSFGENDIFQQMPNEKGTLTYQLQKKFQSVFGFTLPLFHGRGMLNYSVGLMPYRRRIVCVVGRPINVTKCAKPTYEELQEVQAKYIEELYRIWETYKDVYATGRKKELSIVD